MGKTRKVAEEKTTKQVACYLPLHEKALVEMRAQIEGTDTSKWLRLLIRRELARKPKT